MSRIIQIDDLQDLVHDVLIGYVGLDIDLGRLRYFTFFDKDGNFNHDNKNIREFDPRCLPLFSPLAFHMAYANVKKVGFDDAIPKQVKEYFEKSMKNHIKYNKKMGFPVEHLLYNKKTLDVKCDDSIESDFFLSGSYTLLKNTMEIFVDENTWQELDTEERREVKSSVVHEIGHMKASFFKLDENAKQLIIRCGFYIGTIPIYTIALANGDIFYGFAGDFDLSDITLGIAIDDYMNEYECSFVSPIYIPAYPIFGPILNDLCDGRLVYARYTNGLDELYESIEHIDKSIALREDLFASLTLCVANPEATDNVDRARKLIKHYQDKKHQLK